MAQLYDNYFEENAEFEKNLEDSPASDCESGVTGGSSSSSAAAAAASPPPYSRRVGAALFDESLVVPYNLNDATFNLLKHRFITAMTSTTTSAAAAITTDNTLAADVNGKGGINVVAIHRRNWCYDVNAQAKLKSFQSHLKALQYKLNNGVVDHSEAKLNSSPLITFAWFGGSKSKIQQVLSRGFSFSDLQDNPNSAIFLSPDLSPSFSVEKAVEDEEGIRHLVLCRVLLGRCELIGPDSAQTEPSSDEYDSGVDDLNQPKKFIIWSTNMNSHILPEYVMSFTLNTPPPTKVYANKERNVTMGRMQVPNSPWISFPTLIAVLSRRLPTQAIALITKYHNEYKEKRISRPELIKIVRQIAGDKLLIAVIKACRGARELKIPFGFLRNRNANK